MVKPYVCACVWRVCRVRACVRVACVRLTRQVIINHPSHHQPQPNNPPNPPPQAYTCLTDVLMRDVVATCVRLGNPQARGELTACLTAGGVNSCGPREDAVCHIEVGVWFWLGRLGGLGPFGTVWFGWVGSVCHIEVGVCLSSVALVGF